MKSCLTSIVLPGVLSGVLSGALGACFGAGPQPSPPSEATVVYAAPIPSNNSLCTSSVYIANVALGSDLGYVTTVPYTPHNDGQCTGGQAQIAVGVSSFDKNGGNPQGSMVGPAGMSSGQERPRIATNGATVVWLYSNGGSTTIAPGNSSIMSGAGGSLGNVYGAVLDGSGLYLAAEQSQGGFSTDPASPQYPCCGGNNHQPGAASLSRVPLPIPPGSFTPTVLPAPSQGYATAALKDSMVANTSTLFYMTANSGNTAGVFSFPKSGTTGADTNMIGSINLAGSVLPVGLAADSAHVVWSVSYDYSFVSSQYQCSVSSYDLASMVTTVVFQTSRFGCLDAALDGDFVYFAIVSMSGPDNGGPYMRGEGIGRVSLSSHTFESISLGMAGQTAGPRRLYIENHDIYAVDPLVIGKIPTSALEGKLDISP